MDKTIYRMSSAGHCPRRLSARRLGQESTPAPVWLETAAEEGRWHEGRIVDELRHEGWIVGGQQQELIIEKEIFNLTGHIDGIANKDGETYLLEIKSMSQFEFDRWMRGRFTEFPAYADQVTCYMTAMGLNKVFYVVKNRSSGYKDISFQEGTPSDMDVILQKLYGVELATQAGQMIEANFDPMSVECRRCEFKHLCVVKAETLEPATLAALEKAADLWRAGDSHKKQGESLIAEGKAILENHAISIKPEEGYSYNVSKLIVSRFFVKGGPVAYERKPRWDCRITDTVKE